MLNKSVAVESLVVYDDGIKIRRSLKKKTTVLWELFTEDDVLTPTLSSYMIRV